MEEITDAVNQINLYGPLLASGLTILILGTLSVFGLNLLTNRWVFPLLETRGRRLAAVAFGALYVLVLVYSALMLLRRLGYDTSVVGPVALAVVLSGAVLVFFVVPFLPRLPFRPGHMVEIVGALGIVESVSPMHTRLRAFDGQYVLGARSDLWLRVIGAFQADDRVALSVARHEVLLSGRTSEGSGSAPVS